MPVLHMRQPGSSLQRMEHEILLLSRTCNSSIDTGFIPPCRPGCMRPPRRPLSKPRAAPARAPAAAPLAAVARRGSVAGPAKEEVCGAGLLGQAQLVLARDDLPQAQLRALQQDAIIDPTKMHEHAAARDGSRAEAMPSLRSSHLQQMPLIAVQTMLPCLSRTAPSGSRCSPHCLTSDRVPSPVSNPGSSRGK